MGLDMMIYKTPRIEGYTFEDMRKADSYMGLVEYKKNHPKERMTFKDWCGTELPPRKLINIRKKRGDADFIDEVAYWRKVNAIHRWFVDHVQDGKDDCEVHRELTCEDLEELMETCQKVYNGDGQREELLPTQGGFFFGGVDYDDYYYKTIQNTIVQIHHVLETTDFETECLYYMSSW